MILISSPFFFTTDFFSYSDWHRQAIIYSESTCNVSLNTAYSKAVGSQVTVTVSCSRLRRVVGSLGTTVGQPMSMQPISCQAEKVTMCLLLICIGYWYISSSLLFIAGNMQLAIHLSVNKFVIAYVNSIIWPDNSLQARIGQDIGFQPIIGQQARLYISVFLGSLLFPMRNSIAQYFLYLQIKQPSLHLATIIFQLFLFQVINLFKHLGHAMPMCTLQ